MGPCWCIRCSGLTSLFFIFLVCVVCACFGGGGGQWLWNWPSWGLVRFLLLFSICWNWNIAVNLVIALLLMDLLQYPQIGIKYYFITSSLEVIGLFLFFLISRFWQNLVCIFVFVAIWVMVMIVYFLALDLCKKNPISIHVYHIAWILQIYVGSIYSDITSTGSTTGFVFLCPSF